VGHAGVAWIACSPLDSTKLKDALWVVLKKSKKLEISSRWAAPQNMVHVGDHDQIKAIGMFFLLMLFSIFLWGCKLYFTYGNSKVKANCMHSWMETPFHLWK